jgi:hypothetical protein
MSKTKTKKELLNESLAELLKYTRTKDADLSLIAPYLISLSEWFASADSSDPITPPPPPPGH